MISQNQMVNSNSILTLTEIEKLATDMVKAKSMSDLPPIGDTWLGDSSSDYGLLLVHGFTGTNLEMLYLGNFMAARGFRVFVPLLPGHGTDKQDLSRTSYMDWVSKVKSSVNQLLQEKDGRQVILGGHSLGGSMVILVSLEFPSIKGLILLATPIRYSIFRRIVMRLLAKTRLSLRYDQFAFHDKKLFQNPYVKFLGKRYKYLDYKSANEAYKLLGDAYELLDSTRLPVLMIYSLQDHRVSKFQGREMYNRLSSRNKRIVWLENSDHVVVFDSDKKLVAKEVDRFSQSLMKLVDFSASSSRS